MALLLDFECSEEKCVEREACVGDARAVGVLGARAGVRAPRERGVEGGAEREPASSGGGHMIEGEEQAGEIAEGRGELPSFVHVSPRLTFEVDHHQPGG